MNASPITVASSTSSPPPPPPPLKQVNYATWVCFFAWVFAVYDFILFGTLLPRLGEHFGWSAGEQTRLNTWITLGTALVAFAVGPVVDRLGRRKGIIIAVAGAAICSGLTALAGWVVGLSAGLGYFLLIVVRSMAGLGYAEQSINATYLSELFSLVYTDPASVKRRGFIFSLVQSGWTVGVILTGLLVALLYPLGEAWFGTGGGWVLSFLFAVFPAIVIAIVGRRLVETPQFLTARRLLKLRREGRVEEARQLSQAHGLEEQKDHHGGLSAALAIFQGAALRPTIFLSLGVFLNWFSIMIFSILGTSVLGGSGEAAGKGIDFSNALVILVLSNVVGVAGYIFHGWFGDRIGRRNAVGIGWVLGGVAYFLMLNAPQGSFWSIVPLYSMGVFFMNGAYSALLFLMGESFASHIRATAGLFAMAMGQVGAIVVGFGITYTLDQGADWVQTALYWGALPCTVSGILMFFVPHVDPNTVK